MNILNRILVASSLVLLLCGFSSCHKAVDLPYSPMLHNIPYFPTISLAVQDEQGKDQLYDSTFIRSISFFGWERKANIKSTIHRPMDNYMGVPFEDTSKPRTIDIQLDLPNSHKYPNYKTGDTINVVTSMQSSLGNLDFYATYVLIEPPKTVIYGNSLIGMKFLKIGQYPTPPEGYEEDRRITLTYKGGALVPSQK